MAYSIRLCKLDELNKLREFLRTSWRDDHIFLNNNKLLDWQHLEDTHYNFVVANHEETDRFHGILGFISPGFFSSGKVQQFEHIWLAIWKVEKSLAESKSIGIDMLDFVRHQYNPKAISAVGISKEVSYLYRLLGYSVGKLAQSFIVNQSIKKFLIAKCENPERGIRTENEPNPSGPLRIKKVEHSDLTSGLLDNILCERNFGFSYLTERFHNHPTYSYLYYLVLSGENIIAIFVARKIKAMDSFCLRIVDFWGIENCGSNMVLNFQSLLADLNCEYVDIISSVDDLRFIEAMGFKQNDDRCFVPHLFEPYLCKRAEVLYATTAKGHISFFKADSDLDRPNLGVA